MSTRGLVDGPWLCRCGCAWHEHRNTAPGACLTPTCGCPTYIDDSDAPASLLPPAPPRAG